MLNVSRNHKAISESTNRNQTFLQKYLIVINLFIYGLTITSKIFVRIKASRDHGCSNCIPLNKINLKCLCNYKKSDIPLYLHILEFSYKQL